MTRQLLLSLFSYFKKREYIFQEVPYSDAVKNLGWTYHSSAYCQLIRAVNKEKRLRWCLSNFFTDLSNIVWTALTTIQLENHRRFCHRKQGQKPKPKPRPKHPMKVHVWAGISWNGATNICVFKGKMNAELYVEILRTTLLPSVSSLFPEKSFLFMQDNNPKHTSKRAREFFDQHEITWWKTPPESPDLNPIENLWHEIKEFVCCEVKPATKAQLIDGIVTFWNTVDKAKCCKYIGHLRRVILKVIQVR